MENTSAEMTEVAEPSQEVEQTIETGVEEPEAAEPVSEEHQKTETDAAWAEMRRAREAAEREAADVRAELEELKAQQEARDIAINRITGNDNGTIAALAEVTGLSEDEIMAEMEAAQESAQKDLEIEQLKNRLNTIEVQRMMQDDLNAIQRIDPTVKDLADLGEGYVEYIKAGLDPVRAYWALKAEEGANRREPPKAVGKVATGPAEKDYYTDAEIDAMSSEQLTKNWKKVMASWDRRSK